MSHPIQTYSLSRGIELSFTDSGAPPNSVDYTTLLVVHGTAFNAYQFHKLHSYAHALNLRTILLHRRDYVGSTPYSLTELEEISEAKKVFWERLSAQLAEFVVMLIQKEGIPRLTQSTESRSEGLDLKGRGGVAIMGWSFGCATVLSLFGVVKNPMISDKHYDLLQEYIGDFILYDPPHVAFGYPVPSDSPNYVPWEDLTIPLEIFPKSSRIGLVHIMIIHVMTHKVDVCPIRPVYMISTDVLRRRRLRYLHGRRRRSRKASKGTMRRRKFRCSCPVCRKLSVYLPTKLCLMRNPYNTGSRMPR
ncbi:hypothetical protein BDP27DRAFT_1300589 [Rhodocollybia butyracea]|uniref:AB hydrolase-1 domain-containing protein n=1 Tax=Rhodocollybia butyracea TaxID=206335 RepID=A0A9P5PF41_9AGAR|nr:hypothetical protein BDP27DRAFT_1300589 [Rhodocollybia butyracea]